MEKRLLLAVVLSIIIMLVYPFFLAKINPPTAVDESTQLISQQEVIETPPETKPSYKETAIPEATLPEGAKATAFFNDRYELLMSNIGGSIQKIEIKDGKRLDANLVENAIYQGGMLSVEGAGALKELSSQLFDIKKDTNSLYLEKGGLIIEKSLTFLEDRYAMSVSLKLTNHSELPKPVSFELTTGSNISKKEIYESRYVTAEALLKDGKLNRIGGGKLKKYNKLYNKNIEWIALKNKYYSIIAKPDFAPDGFFTKEINGEPAIGFIVDDRPLQKDETRRYDFILYIGPTEINELEKVDATFGKALNFGVFTSISLVLLSILKFFYSLFHNYGVSILLLTCCVSGLLYPLTFKSMSSMRRLQELQPQVEKVRAECKDNPHKLNKEIMELYRRYKVNPMSGCFPIFLQMPIFIALYQTLMRSVELKGAHFLWIKDLSMPDAAFQLPFTLPILGNTINILPILMIGAMIIQQKTSTMKASAAQTEQQKMMGSIMPIVFGFIFYSLPSGLVLYWLTNTILTSSLQFFMLRKT